MGCILHGSRSGLSRPVDVEFQSTVNYVRNGTDGVTGWNATGGNGEVSVHFDAGWYGWHARAASDEFLAFEFAQGTEANAITDAQVRGFAAWWTQEVEPRWPGITRHFPTHAEVEMAGLTGERDGKTDVFGVGNPASEELRSRIRAELDRLDAAG